MSKKKKLPHIPELSARVLNHVKADRKRLTTLTLFLALFVFCILLAAIGLTVLGVFILQWAGVISGLYEEMDMTLIVIFMSVISLILGWVLVFFSIRIPLKPIHTLISRMNRLAMGDFSTRMEDKGMLANHPAFKGIRDSFNSYPVDRLAQAAATASILDVDYTAKTVGLVVAARDRAYSRLKEAGIEVLKSATNFLFVKAGEDAAPVQQALRSEGILVRHFGSQRLKSWLRVTIGTTEDMEKVTDALIRLIKG